MRYTVDFNVSRLNGDLPHDPPASLSNPYWNEIGVITKIRIIYELPIPALSSFERGQFTVRLLDESRDRGIV